MRISDWSSDVCSSDLYVRRRFNLPYWSLSKHAKHKVKNAVEFISHYEEAVARAAHIKGMDGVVCGHIHTAETRQFGDITYYNDGDRSEEHTSELQSLMRISYAVFCLKKKKENII